MQNDDAFAEAFKQVGGCLFAKDGAYATLEHQLPGSAAFKLVVVGRFHHKENRTELISKQAAHDIEQRLASCDGSDVEYLATGRSDSALVPTHCWDGWNALNKGPEHVAIYDYLKRTIDECASSAKNALVIGCGTGEFLDYLAAQGIDATGVEANARSCAIAKARGRNVVRARLPELPLNDRYELVIDAGVLTAEVMCATDAVASLDAIATRMDDESVFVQIPFSRSLLSGIDLRRRGLDLLQRTEPKNLFTLDFPKQVYVAYR